MFGTGTSQELVNLASGVHLYGDICSVMYIPSLHSWFVTHLLSFTSSLIQPCRSRRYALVACALLRGTSAAKSTTPEHASQHVHHRVPLPWYLDAKVHLAQLIQRLVPIHVLQVRRIVALELSE